ncbi:MAG TPA: RDD family protein, partial [Candidatus Acidoferrales bacterium]|nr:RDD family protein [Candidatus Acidoferrales bacterium]
LAIFSGFIALGGRFAAGKTEVLICLATVGLLAAQYFTLFTVMGGTTPGMMITGLRLVSFEGDAPAPSQLVWRSIGYLISGGTAFLGYLWSLWDEDELTWHDRISQTYITPAEAAVTTESSKAHGPSELHT